MLSRNIQGHEAALLRQEEAASLELQWMKEYGSTWRTRGVFGVSSALVFMRIQDLTRMPDADGHPYDRGSEGILFIRCNHFDPIPNYRFARQSSTCSISPATITPR